LIVKIGRKAILTFQDENGNILLTRLDIREASSFDYDSQFYVGLNFNEQGARTFEEVTRNNIGKHIYIYLDDELITAPIVGSAITNGECIISGNYSKEEAEYMALVIIMGALPFDLIDIDYFKTD